MVFASDANELEQLRIIRDAETGVSGVIAIHSTALGPAAGGCRLWHYESEDDMIADAKRLARGMSFKNAMAGLPFGGGKAVLQRPKGAFDRAALFRIFGEAVRDLGGSYVTAEDVGTTVEDMKQVHDYTRYVAGLEPKPGLAGGDPSPWTALGVFESMKVAANFALEQDLHVLTVAVQGTGNVGGELCGLLHRAGAKLIIADIDSDRVLELARRYDAEVVGIDEIAAVEADIFAPCALGGALNERSVANLRARIVCGGANNQLATEADGIRLFERGIIYAPDYLVNAGGIINVAAEYLGETPTDVAQRVRKIADRLATVLKQAALERQATNLVADELARDLIAAAEKQAA